MNEWLIECSHKENGGEKLQIENNKITKKDTIEIIKNSTKVGSRRFLKKIEKFLFLDAI